MHHAQPALLYIVPCTLIPVMLTACIRGEFREIWDGDRETQLVSKMFDAFTNVQHRFCPLD